MSRYQIQHEIFTLSMALYPEDQHEEIYKHLKKLWTRPDSTLQKYLNVLREIV